MHQRLKGSFFYIFRQLSNINLSVNLVSLSQLPKHLLFSVTKKKKKQVKEEKKKKDLNPWNYQRLRITNMRDISRHSELDFKCWGISLQETNEK